MLIKLLKLILKIVWGVIKNIIFIAIGLIILFLLLTIMIENGAIVI